MHRTRFLSAWMLLLAFVAGGLVGPAAHQVHHAADHAPAVTQARAGACHSDAVHAAETPVLAADAFDAPALTCELCATRHVVTPPGDVEAPSPTHVPTWWSAEGTHVAPLLFVARTVIRGPPLLS